MLDTIGAFGSGIGTNLLSDSLSKKLEAFKDKKAISSFTQSLRDWEIEFEKQNDGTIITNGAFYSHVKYHNVIENIVAYVLDPSMNAVTEDEFLNCLHEKMVSRIEETTEKKLSWNDSRLIRNFLTHLLTTTRAFLFEKISLEDRGLFYLFCQNNAKLEHLERIVKEKFQMQDQNIQQIVEQLSMVIQKSETEERIKAKMVSWNSRQIKNLGNRYTPDLNIPVEIMDSLHGASVDQQFQNIFYNKVDKFLIAMRHTKLSEINALCDAIEKYVIELNFFNITSSDIDAIISTVNAIKDFLTSKIEEYYENPEGKKSLDSKADVFHPTVPIPIPVDGNERSSTVTTGKQSRIPMTGSVAFCPLAALFLEQRLCLLPIFSGNDGRVYILVTEPLFFGNFSEPLAIPHFVLVVIENANIAFILENILDAGVRPEELTDIRFLLAVEFHLELRRCFALLLIQNSGDGHKRHSVKE